MSKSSGFNLREAVGGSVALCLEDILDVTAAVMAEVGQEATERIKVEAPKRTGLYAKSWKWMQESGRLKTTVRVYGTGTASRLSHLLENGHLSRNGKRVPPSPVGGHIKKVEEWANNEVVARIERIMNQ